MSCNMTPNPGSYFEGLYVILKILNTNTGASVLNVNSLGNKNIVRSDNSALVAGDLTAGIYVCLFYDGTKFRTVWSTGTVAGAPVFLTATKDLYVNGTIGNDTYDGTSATFVSGVKGPFATIQRAANEVPKFNLNGFTLTIHVADGTYVGADFGAINGAGQVNLTGNVATPANCGIPGSNRSALVFSGGSTSPYQVQGFALSATGSRVGDPISAVVSSNANVVVGTNTIGATVGGQLYASNGGTLSNIAGCTWTINGSAPGAAGALLWVTGSGSQFLVNAGGGPGLVFVNNPTTYGVATVVSTSLSLSFLIYSGITNAAFVAGSRYNVSLNAVIQTNGGGATYYPGNAVGVVGSGGTYA